MECRTEQLIRLAFEGDPTISKDLADDIVSLLKQQRTTSKEGLVTVPGACEFLAVSRSTLHRLVHDGEVGCIRIRGRKLFDVRDLRRFVVRNRIRKGRR